MLAKGQVVLIVPTLRVGMQPVTLRVTTMFDNTASNGWNAECPLRHSHAGERGNDQQNANPKVGVSLTRHHRLARRLRPFAFGGVLALLGSLKRGEHGGFFDHAILHQALRQTAEPGALTKS